MPDPTASDNGLRFVFRVGTSFLDDFAFGHTPADVLRELVQNEYDARGTEIAIEFGDDALIVRGNGTPIDGRGWKRLSVMFGTGLIGGSRERIDAKVNDIGSKNFGLRSLFFFGDRITVASGGQQTILDCIHGSLETPLPDPPSAGTPGVVITVPYREAPSGKLQVFDKTREHEALKTITTRLAPTLVKLAQPAGGKSLRSGVVRSERLGQELRWHQRAQRVPGSIRTVRRNIRVEASPDLLGDAPDSITEVEYQVVLRPPRALPKRDDIPGYFRVAGGRIHLGLSVRLRRKRLDLDPAGLLYYPLGAAGAVTGFPFSLSAPFDMNEERSNIIDPENSYWNAWLLEEGARFAIRLLPQELFLTYGADAFIAIDPGRVATTAIPLLRDMIRQLLNTEQCWPSRARRRGDRPMLTSASDLVVPGDNALGELTAKAVLAEKMLDDRLAERSKVTDLAIDCGAQIFTVGSLVRLRCAGVDSGQLATRLKTGEAKYYYTDFPGRFESLEVQHMFAAAIEESWAHLEAAHKIDLRRAPTTLTAAETLAAAESLWVMDEKLAGVVPNTKALHPELARYRNFSRLCRGFNVSKWAIDTSKQIADATASADDRDALAAYLRAEPHLTEKAWAAVRNVPVLSDRNGKIVAARNMVLSSVKGASLLAPALHLPLPEDEDNKSLKPLKFRTKLNGADLVALASLVEQGDAAPTVMGMALSRLPKLLTRSVLVQLEEIRFLATASGTLVAPADSYVRSDRLVAVLGEDAPYAVGLSSRLLRQLGSRVEARADDIIATLSRWRETGRSPARPDHISRALVEALRREHRPPDEFREQEILWTGNTWEAPADCVVGLENRKTFLGPVTVLSSGLRNVWRALGATNKPTERHWRRLFIWAGERYGSREKAPKHVADSLRRAYRELDQLPEGTPQKTKCLVDDSGRLHSIGEVITRRFVINDDPALAEAAAQAGASVAFATPLDRQEASFFAAIGVWQLSAVARLQATEYGPPVLRDGSQGEDTTLQRLRAPHFASAVATFVSAVQGAQPRMSAAALAARLARIARIAVVDGIDRRYELLGTSVVVSVNYLVTDDEIFVNRVQDTFELRRAVAHAVAEIAYESPLSHQVVGDAIFFLLRCRSTSAMRQELERRKVAWRPTAELDIAEFDDDEDEDDEDQDDEDQDDESASLAASIARTIVRNALSKPAQTASADRKLAEISRSARPPLPDIRDVKPQLVGSPGRLQEPVGSRGRLQEPVTRPPSGAGPGAWAPRDDDARAEDEALGRQGEEIILGIERRRVEELGWPPDRVVWTARDAPLADHDIKSVDDDGEDLWIEVKSTRGRDGRFNWTGAEFLLAVRARRRYILYRVYEADTVTPICKPVRDPIGSFETGDLTLDLDRLAADLGPPDAPTDP
jgi:hypothetical protein